MLPRPLREVIAVRGDERVALLEDAGKRGDRALGLDVDVEARVGPGGEQVLHEGDGLAAADPGLGVCRAGLDPDRDVHTLPCSRSRLLGTMLRLRGMDEELLIIRAAWPATTIDGDPGIVSGLLTVSRAIDGGVHLNLAVGPLGGGPEECEYVEFLLSADNATALGEVLADG